MIARTSKTKTRSNEDALAAFVARKGEIDAMLSQLQTLSDEHFGTAPDEVTWGHVGTLEHHAELFKRITDSAFNEGEHADSRADLPPPPRAAPAAGARVRRRATMLSADGDHPMTTTDLSKKQLATILSALDDAPRSPANKGEALRAIGRSAQRFGLTTDDVLAAAPGPARWPPEPGRLPGRTARPGGAPVPATDAPQAAPEAQEGDAAGQEPQSPTEPVQAAVAPAAAKRKAKTQAAKAKAPKPAKTAPADKPTPRAGTKQAQMIELLRRPEGATVEQIAAATGWQQHTIRGAIAGALKKKLGLTVEATRTREVGPKKTGAKGSTTIYRIVG